MQKETEIYSPRAFITLLVAGGALYILMESLYMILDKLGVFAATCRLLGC